VYYSRDPSTNVVLLEDFAAVLGLTIAATCISITHYTGNPLPDAVGSLLIGTLLGGVASFIIYTNTMSLVGRLVTLFHYPTWAPGAVAFHPSKVVKLSSSLIGWRKGGNVTSVGWQVTLFDSIWRLSSCSSESLLQTATLCLALPL